MLSVDSFLKEVTPKSQNIIKPKDWVFIVHTLCKTYGWTYQELVEQPIPFVYGLLDGLHIEKELEEKAYKKAKK